MQYALTILTYLFDMFILTTFLMNTLHHFKKRYAPLYLCVLVGCECCLYGCEVLNSHFLPYNQKLPQRLSVWVQRLSSAYFSQAV